MKTEIFLLRHGETDFNNKKLYYGHLDPSMNETGKQNIYNLKKKFNEEIDIVFSSDSFRCFESSLIFTEDNNAPLLVNCALKELNFGIFEGQTYEQLEKNFPKETELFFKGDFDYTIPQGESLNTFFDRCTVFFKKIIKKHQGKKILISSHGGVIRSILSYAISQNLDNYWKFFIPNASLTKLVYEKDFFYIEYTGLKGLKAL